jgi:hypothetical protein
MAVVSSSRSTIGGIIAERVGKYRLETAEPHAEVA